MKDRINEYDMTKKMMDIIRGDYKTLLTENDKDTINPQQGDAIFKDELNKLQDTVDPSVRISSFKIYPNDHNVIIDGTFLQKNDESGITFKMDLANGDIETSMNNIDLSDKVSQLLQKLKGYYENWVDEWYLKLANEYKPKKD